MPAQNGNQTAILNALAGGDCMVLDQLCDAIPDVGRRALINALCRLVERGLVERVERGCVQLSEAGRTAQASGLIIKSGPRGPMERRRPVRNSLNTRLWRAMRIKGKFTIPALLELAARDEKDPANATRRYVRALEKAGFVLRLNRREAGTSPTSNGFVRFSLVRDTGDQAPMLRRGSVVFDPNTGSLWRDGQEVQA